MQMLWFWMVRQIGAARTGGLLSCQVHREIRIPHSITIILLTRFFHSLSLEYCDLDSEKDDFLGGSF
jgi:hypothetical protein